MKLPLVPKVGVNSDKCGHSCYLNIYNFIKISLIVYNFSFISVDLLIDIEFEKIF